MEFDLGLIVGLSGIEGLGIRLRQGVGEGVWVVVVGKSVAQFGQALAHGMHHGFSTGNAVACLSHKSGPISMATGAAY